MPASYSLGSHYQAFIERQVRSRRYLTASEVVREGLRLMEERETEREARLEGLRAEGSRELGSGVGIATEQVLARMRAWIDEAERAARGAA